MTRIRRHQRGKSKRRSRTARNQHDDPGTEWKALPSTNVIERLHEEFRRRVKTQGSLPSGDAAMVLLFSLVANGQIKLRRIDGWRKIATVLSRHPSAAA